MEKTSTTKGEITMEIKSEMVVRSVLAFGLIVISHVVQAEQRDLNADEVTVMFSGNTATGEHAFKKKKSMVYFSPDGTYKGKRLDKNTSRQGKWSVDDKAQLCMEKDGDTRCRRVVDDNGTIKKYKKNKHVWTFTKFEDGDKL
jgi:hypothetical protein